ncbi:MAG: FAD-dependent oxidoreductase [Lachnospiraceae bacterium]|nr:FAD-dependent oxidoreductase [Lachnospiraceae bacterium]MDE7238743.1 FAD-dependent oxidoreductase [Lachnospiraceae bacterium]
MDTVVLGAGIAGLGYLNSYAECENIRVYEKDSRPGGLCKSFTINGFTFDSAVHLSFTKSEAARELFDKTQFTRHEPIAYNFYNGKYIKHPVINNLSCFSPEERCEYIESFLDRSTGIEIANYGDWLLGSYGRAFKRDFYDCYTRKYWRMEADELSTTWIGKRLQNPDFHKILMGSFTSDTGIDYYANEMRYPVEGGYEAFLDPLIKRDHIIYNKDVVGIDTAKKEVFFHDGDHVHYDKLVSSLPLCRMPEIVRNVPENVTEAAKRLKYTKVSIVSIGFHKLNIAKHLWMYIYDEDIMAARVNSPGIKSSNNVPAGYSSLQFEIYHGDWEKINREEVIENTLYALRKMKLCQKDDIEFVDYRLLPFGNVIFYNGMENDRDIVRNYLKKEGIHTIGRFGEWDYLWSDQSLLSGVHGGQCEVSVSEGGEKQP